MVTHLTQHWGDVLSGVTLMAILAHALNTFPTPANQYGQWILGILKFAVGQRISGMNAIRGNDTVAVPVPQGTGAGVQSTQSHKSNMAVSDQAITITEEKKTKAVIPTGPGTGTGE